MADKVKDVAKSEALRIGSLAGNAAKSGAYMYPIKGIFYFIAHRSLWKPLTSRIGPTVTLGLSITSAMFFFTYVPQLALLALTSGPLAPISAALLVLSESSTLTNALSNTFLLNEALVDTFDGTLVSRGHEALVSDGRQLKSGGMGDPISRLGKLVKKPFAKLSPAALIRSVLYLPLNFIPVVGTLVYIVVQGKRIGPTAHDRYFQLKGWDRTRKEEWLKTHAPEYTSFGVLSFVLEMVPVLSFAFTYTSTVGAALWAADIEAKASTSPSLREQAKRAE
jgi:uncharacterized protein involved in cysteine biosynthesis